MLFKTPIFASQFQISTLIWGYPVHMRVHICFSVGFILESLATECLRLVMCLNFQCESFSWQWDFIKGAKFVELLYYWVYFSLRLYAPVICSWRLRTVLTERNCKALCKVSRAGGVRRKIPKVDLNEPPVLMCSYFLVSSILWYSHIWLCDDNGNHL